MAAIATVTEQSSILTKQRSRWRSLPIGAGLGIAYGVAARGWMRLIATDPEFTWSGTLSILLAFGIIGLLLGLAYAAAANPAPRLPTRVAHAAGLAGIVLLAASPGAVMVPPIVYGAAALRGTRPRWPWRLLLGLAAGLGVLAIGVGGSDSVLPLAALGALAVLVATGWRFRIVCAVGAALTSGLVAGGPVRRAARVARPARQRRLRAPGRRRSARLCRRARGSRSR